MNIKLYQVDAFASQLFSGNPAAVCPLNEWLPTRVLQNIAMENNLAETAFYIREGFDYHIRWFTPVTEVDLCGHATLATAHVLFHYEGETREQIVFNSRSGKLSVAKAKNLLTLNFPSDTLEEIPLTGSVTDAFDIKPLKLFRGSTDLMMVYAGEDDIRYMVPDFGKIKKLDCRGVIITAPGKSVDFVSRFFAPQAGIDEDPVTGSAHTSLTPYWSAILNKKTLEALQLSARGGRLTCTHRNERTEISGEACTYLIGNIFTET